MVRGSVKVSRVSVSFNLIIPPPTVVAGGIIFCC